MRVSSREEEKNIKQDNASAIKTIPEISGINLELDLDPGPGALVTRDKNKKIPTPPRVML